MTTSPSGPIPIPVYAFYNILALMRGLKPDFAATIGDIGREMRATKVPFDEEAERLVSASKEFASDVKARTRRKVAELDGLRAEQRSLRVWIRERRGAEESARKERVGRDAADMIVGLLDVVDRLTEEGRGQLSDEEQALVDRAAGWAHAARSTR